MTLIINNTGHRVDPRDPSLIPEAILEALTSWKNGEHPHPPGGYVEAFLCGDFEEALKRADIESMIGFVATYNWAYNNLPMSSWGSTEKYAAWLSDMRRWYRSQSDATKVGLGPIPPGFDEASGKDQSVVAEIDLSGAEQRVVESMTLESDDEEDLPPELVEDLPFNPKEEDDDVGDVVERDDSGPDSPRVRAEDNLGDDLVPEER